MGSGSGMNLREAFCGALQDLVAQGNNIVTLDCEVGTATYTTQFGEKYPERHYEMGVAEQNMFGVAAGMAACGVIPFAATFAVFASMRACEMARTSICYPNRNVKMIGGYAGLSNGKDGATHHSIEDIAIMRAMPNNTVVVCSDPVITRKIVHGAVEHTGPVYIRMEYEVVPDVHKEETQFQFGKGVLLKEGADVSILTVGTAVVRALEAAEQLGKQGINAEVIDMLCVKPIDRELLAATARKTGAVITVEDHSRIGGFASAVAEVLLEEEIPVKWRALGIDDLFTESGNTDELRARYGIDANSIIKAAVLLTGKGA